MRSEANKHTKTKKNKRNINSCFLGTMVAAKQVVLGFLREICVFQVAFFQKSNVHLGKKCLFQTRPFKSIFFLGELFSLTILRPTFSKKQLAGSALILFAGSGLKYPCGIVCMIRG